MFHVHPLGSLIEDTQETGHELKQAVGPAGLSGLGMGTILCTYLSLGLPWQRYVRFIVWLAVGIVIYLSYGYPNADHHAVPRRGRQQWTRWIFRRRVRPACGD